MYVKSNFRLLRLILISILLMVMLAVPSPVHAGTLEVDPSDCAGAKYCTIQDALNAANNGDIIILAAATYPESIDVTKNNITITGAGIDQSIIDASGANDYSIYVTGDGVTIQNLTLKGNNTFASAYGFKISHVANFTLKNVKVYNTRRTGVDLHTVNGALIQNVESNGAAWGNGFAVTDCTNITFTNISSSGNPWGGLAIYTNLTTTENITVNGTNNLTEGIYLQTANGNEVKTLSLDGYGFVVQNETDYPNYFFFFETKAAADAFAASLPNSGDSIVFKMTTAGQIGPWYGLQNAVDDASSGDTLYLSAGVWDEGVTVTKTLTFVGMGSDSDSLENTIIYNNTATLISLEANGLSFMGIQFRPDNEYAFEVPGTTAVSGLTLNDVKIIGQALPNNTESQVGIKVATGASLSNVVITNTVFSNLSYGWYFAKHGDWGPGGSVVDTVQVTDSTFLNNYVKGIYVEKLTDATFTRVTVIGNGHYTAFWNANWNAGFDINLKGEETYENIIFNDVTFINNGLGAKEGAALMIKGRDDGGTYGAHPAALDTVTFNGCYITGNERGIRFGEPGKGNTSPTNVSVSNCYFDGNVQTYAGTDGSVYGAFVNASTQTDLATNNWWGEVDGPSGIGAGSGDAVNGSGPVTYSPFLTTPPTYLMGKVLNEAGGAVSFGDFNFVFPAALLPEYAFANFKFTGVDGSGPGPAGYDKLDITFSLEIHQTDGTQLINFGLPFSVCYSYTTADLALVGGDATKFSFASRPAGGSAWEILHTTLDTNVQTICADVVHLSDFSIIQFVPVGGGVNTDDARADADGAFTLPETGFAPDRMTYLPIQLNDKAYRAVEIEVEVPALNLRLPIVGVPETDEGWDVRWLGDRAGYLMGTAFPTWAGNTVLTAHVYDASGLPGPFAQLKNLQYGDKIYIHAWNELYVYEIRDTFTAMPWQTASVLGHSDYDILTLITCEDFNESYGTYSQRRVVQAVLIEVITD